MINVYARPLFHPLHSFISFYFHLITSYHDHFINSVVSNAFPLNLIYILFKPTTIAFLFIPFTVIHFIILFSLHFTLFQFISLFLNIFLFSIHFILYLSSCLPFINHIHVPLVTTKTHNLKA